MVLPSTNTPHHPHQCFPTFIWPTGTGETGVPEAENKRQRDHENSRKTLHPRVSVWLFAQAVFAGNVRTSRCPSVNVLSCSDHMFNVLSFIWTWFSHRAGLKPPLLKAVWCQWYGQIYFLFSRLLNHLKAVPIFARKNAPSGASGVSQRSLAATSCFQSVPSLCLYANITCDCLLIFFFFFVLYWAYQVY